MEKAKLTPNRVAILFACLFIFSISLISTDSSSTTVNIDYQYDGNGNIVNDGVKIYEYNGFNELSKVYDSDTDKLIVEFFYDGEGTRVMKIEQSPYLKTLYSGDYVITLNENDNVLSKSLYIYANNMLAGELRIDKDGNTQKLFYHLDHLGSVDIVTNENGDVVSDTDYLPYGIEARGSTVDFGEERYGYTGQESDDEIGLQYYISRYYDPELGRFIQPDSMLPNVYDPQALNRYSYVQNNPVKYTDPSGHSANFAFNPVGYMAKTANGVMSAFDNAIDGFFYGSPDTYGEIAADWVGVRDGGKVALGASKEMSGGANGQSRTEAATGGAWLASGGVFKFITKIPGIKYTDPKSLIPHHGMEVRGPKVSLNKIAELKESILKFGFDNNKPIEYMTVGNNKIITQGHHRNQAAIELGMTNVPIEDVTSRLSKFQKHFVQEYSKSYVDNAKGVLKWNH